MWTIPEATTAIYAKFRVDLCLPILYAYGLGRTVFNAVDTPCAGFFIQLYRINEFVQKFPSLQFKNAHPW